MSLSIHMFSIQIETFLIFELVQQYEIVLIYQPYFVTFKYFWHLWDTVLAKQGVWGS